MISTHTLLRQTLLEYSDNPDPSEHAEREHYRRGRGRVSARRSVHNEFVDDNVNVDQECYEVTGSYELNVCYDGDWDIEHLEFTVKTFDENGNPLGTLTKEQNPALWTKIEAKITERQLQPAVDSEIAQWYEGDE